MKKINKLGLIFAIAYIIIAVVVMRLHGTYAPSNFWVYFPSLIIVAPLQYIITYASIHQDATFPSFLCNIVIYYLIGVGISKFVNWYNKHTT